MQLGASTIPILPVAAVAAAVLLAGLVLWGVLRARRTSAPSPLPARHADDESSAPCAEDWTGEAAGGAADPPPPPPRPTVADAVAARRAGADPFPGAEPRSGSVRLDETAPWPPRAAPERIRPESSTPEPGTSRPLPRPRPTPVRITASPVPPPADPAVAETAIMEGAAEPTGAGDERGAADVLRPAPAPSGSVFVDSTPTDPTLRLDDASGRSGASPENRSPGQRVPDGSLPGDPPPVSPVVGDAGPGSSRPPGSSGETRLPGKRISAAPMPADSVFVDPTPTDPTVRSRSPHADPTGTSGRTAGATPIADALAAEAAGAGAAAGAGDVAEAGAAAGAGDAAEAGKAAGTAETGAPAAPRPDGWPGTAWGSGAVPGPRTEPEPAAARRSAPAPEDPGGPGDAPVADGRGGAGEPVTAAAHPAAAPEPRSQWDTGRSLPAGDLVETVGDLAETAEDVDDLEPIGTGPVPPPWSAARSSTDAGTDAAATDATTDPTGAPVSFAVRQALAAREVRRAQNRTEGAEMLPDARDRLLSVLLTDPVAALGATGELDDTRERIDRLGDVLRRRRAELATAVHRLHEAGLTGDQIGRLAGLEDTDVRSILDRREESR